MIPTLDSLEIGGLASSCAAPAKPGHTSIRRPLVALLGNPNTGKSTLFNRLTGLRQHIANDPGMVETTGHLRSVLRNEKWTSGPRSGQPVYTLPVVVGLMVFFALCMQCGATVAIIARELDWRWATLSFFIMTTLAWLFAVVIYQIGSRL